MDVAGNGNRCGKSVGGGRGGGGTHGTKGEVQGAGECDQPKQHGEGGVDAEVETEVIEAAVKLVLRPQARPAVCDDLGALLGAVEEEQYRKPQNTTSARNVLPDDLTAERPNLALLLPCTPAPSLKHSLASRGAATHTSVREEWWATRQVVHSHA